MMLTLRQAQWVFTYSKSTIETSEQCAENLSKLTIKKRQ